MFVRAVCEKTENRFNNEMCIFIRRQTIYNFIDETKQGFVF